MIDSCEGHPWNGMQAHMLLCTPGAGAGVTIEQMLVYPVKGWLLPHHQPIQRSRTYVGSMEIQYLNKEHRLGFLLKRSDIPFSLDLGGPCGAFNWEQVNITLVAGEFSRWNETEAVAAGGLTAAAKYLSIFLPYRGGKKLLEKRIISNAINTGETGGKMSSLSHIKEDIPPNHFLKDRN